MGFCAGDEGEGERQDGRAQTIRGDEGREDRKKQREEVGVREMSSTAGEREARHAGCKDLTYVVMGALKSTSTKCIATDA